MSQNFLSCDRDQPMLLPPDLREWLPEDHLAWFVLDAVSEIDLEPFFSGYRSDGWGRAAHDPEMMVALPSGADAARAVAPGKHAHAATRSSRLSELWVAPGRGVGRHRPPAPQVAKSHGSIDTGTSGH